MCGIAGVYSGRPGDPYPRERAALMAERLRRRGPDGAGAWEDDRCGLALSHRRLAVIDTSGRGAQPMTSRCGRFVVTYNGEIYNYREISRSLPDAARPDPSAGDTEVLLAALSRWGVEKTLPRLCGMFAFALWDRRDRRLTLVRDRLGVKPLYYGTGSRGEERGVFAFGSEADVVASATGAAVDRRAARSVIRHGYVPAPFSAFEGVMKLSPGSLLDVTAGPDGRPVAGPVVPFWTAPSAGGASRAAGAGPAGDDTEALDRLDAAVSVAVSRRFVSDVPVGVLLSGGVDSSLVAAHAASGSATVDTFTAAFGDPDYDERRYAAAVAAALGTRHHEIVIDEALAAARVPGLAGVYDEPFGDSSALPTLLVAEFARRHVTVVLTGDGADEVFGGYNRYLWAARLASVTQGLPPWARRAVGAAGRLLPDRPVDAAYRIARRGLPRSLRFHNPGGKVRRFLELTAADARDDLYQRLLLLRHEEPPLLPERPVRASSIEEMMASDTRTYLPDDVLVKTDRASMWCSLEAREPLLDHELVEAAWSLPASFVVRGGEGKWALKRLLARRLPERLVYRPKMGFSVPIGRWLRKELKGWATDLLTARALEEVGVEPQRVLRELSSHLRGTTEEGARLWPVLQLVSWSASSRADPRRVSGDGRPENPGPSHPA